MDRLSVLLFILVSCTVYNSIVAQQYFVQGTRPVYIISESGEEPTEVGDGRYDTEAVESESDPSEFFSRSGLTSSEEEVAKDEEYEGPSNGSSKLPPNFSEEANRNRRFPPRRPPPQLKADPGSIERKEYDDEVPNPPNRGLSRFLWPFSLSVGKGKGDHHGHHGGHGPPAHLGGPFHQHHHHSPNRRHGHGGHHHHGHGGYGHNHGHLHGHGGHHHAPHGWGHGYYNHYPTKGKGHHHHHYDVAEPFKGLTEHDYEILESKGYKKYQLKKKKKIKKLKKKLKLKRILQKILEKKINYFDNLGIEGGWGY